MKKLLTAFLLILLVSILSTRASVTVPSNDPLIEYTGRIDFSDPLAPRFSYSGVSVRAAFQGKSIAIKLKDDGNQNFYNVLIDHSVVKRIQTNAGLQTYTISTTLTDTIHEVEIFKLTELTFGKTQFCGFVIEDGKTLVELSDKRTRMIEFIGNSITCGYGNEGTNGQQFGPTTENHFLTYAGYTSRNFNARHLAVCKSGIGIYRNYGGPATGNADNMTNYYQRIFLYDAAPLYNFTQKPDLVCIDLGTNDFSTSQGDSARYVSKYFELIRTIQQKYNGMDVLCLVGPMMGGNDLLRVKRYLSFIADSASKYNNGKVSFFEMSQQTGSLGIGIDWHPTVAQHLQNAKELTAFISKLKGWTVIPYALSVTISKADEIIISFNTPIQDPANNFKGFTLNDDTSGPVAITGVTIDATDKSKLHLQLSKSLSVKSIVRVGYRNGSIESTAMEKMQDFGYLAVTNKLTETKMTKATVDATGTRITLTFGKNILLPESAALVSLANSHGKVYTIKAMSRPTTTTLLLTINEKVVKGDSVLITAGPSIYGTDLVELTPVEGLLAVNQSTVTAAKVTRALGFTIFPNPAPDGVIHYLLPEKDQPFSAQLLSLKGTLIKSYPLYNHEGIIDLKPLQLPSGAYLLRISLSGKEYTQKVVM
ncbi:MAG: GDSL-type esterase/lipase family protein [Candidatus Saccharibacteria bacterium]